jgi:hypothetical protein
MFLLSLPYLIIFIIGCHSMYLFNMIYDEREAREKDNAPPVQSQREQIRQPLLNTRIQSSSVAAKPEKKTDPD